MGLESQKVGSRGKRIQSSSSRSLSVRNQPEANLSGLHEILSQKQKRKKYTHTLQNISGEPLLSKQLCQSHQTKLQDPYFKPVCPRARACTHTRTYILSNEDTASIEWKECARAILTEIKTNSKFLYLRGNSLCLKKGHFPFLLKLTEPVLCTNNLSVFPSNPLDSPDRKYSIKFRTEETKVQRI